MLAFAFSILHLLALAYCIMAINYLLGGQPFEHLLANLMVDNGLFFLLIYLGLVFLPRSQGRDLNIGYKEKPSKFKSRVVVQRGGSTYFLEVAKISMVKSVHGCSIVYLDDASRVSIDGPLIHFETQLDPLNFCRVHRQTIVKVSDVVQCTSRGNGDYDLTLRNGIGCRLSRRYRETFRDLQTWQSDSV
jgi:DNA-binding LytR/AlgR family response regulator